MSKKKVTPKDGAQAIVATKPVTKKVDKSDKPAKKLSITKALHALFLKVGVDEVKLDVALKLAKKIKPDTAFNDKHLAWHKHQWRTNILPTLQPAVS